MTRHFYSLSLLLISAMISGLLVTLGNRWASPPRRPLLGIYQATETVIQKADLGLDVLFLDWNDDQSEHMMTRFIQRAHQQKLVPLITLEPFIKQTRDHHDTDLIAAVLSGGYDPAIARVASALKKARGSVLLRFGHEMDKGGQYPWSVSDPSRFISLYRYVHLKLQPDSARSPAARVNWVWSPAGSSHADRFWPGSQYVDVIGISIYSSRAWSPRASLESFEAQLRQKIWLQHRFRKPLLVAEAGVSGSAQDQLIWLQKAINALSRYPEICGFVYFHAPQPSWMPLPTGQEQWQLKPLALQWLLEHSRPDEKRGLSCVEG